MPVWKVFIHGAHGYLGRHLVAAMDARRQAWDGGAEPPAVDEEDPSTVTRRLVVLDAAPDQTLEQKIASADVIVVDVFESVDDALALIKAVRSLNFTTPKTLICVSTILTWAGTAHVPEQRSVCD